MSGRGILLLCLLIASLVTTALVHAREAPDLTTLECSGMVHSDGDMDQSPGDAAQGVAHHHGCHASPAFVTAAVDEIGAFAPGALRPLMMPSAPPGRRSIGPNLRPPIA